LEIEFIDINMTFSFHFIAFLVNEYFTPEWQKEVRYFTREVVAAMHEADKKKIYLNTDGSSF